jgi:hypothetical protein
MPQARIGHAGLDMHGGMTIATLWTSRPTLKRIQPGMVGFASTGTSAMAKNVGKWRETVSIETGAQGG